MVVVGQSVTLPVPGLAEESNIVTQNLMARMKVLQRSAVPHIHQIIILIQASDSEGARV